MTAAFMFADTLTRPDREGAWPVTMFLIVCWTITGIALVITGIYLAATSWWSGQSARYWTDYAEAKRRDQHPPWYVRFAKWTFRDKADR